MNSILNNWRDAENKKETNSILKLKRLMKTSLKKKERKKERNGDEFR
jgi:hypothetical protein